MDGITTRPASTIMIAGRIDDLETLGTLIAGIVLGVQIMTMRFSSGWRLMLVCHDKNALNSCSIIIRDRVMQGMIVTVLNGMSPMPTRIYTVSP